MEFSKFQIIQFSNLAQPCVSKSLNRMTQISKNNLKKIHAEIFLYVH